MSEKTVSFPHEEYKHRFLVSDQGKIFSKLRKNEIKTIVSNGRNVFFVDDTKNGTNRQYRVDEIIAEAFLENKKGRPYLIHKDGDNLNDRADNLAWVTVPNYLKKNYEGEWKPIQTNPDYYISSKGQVWSSLSGKMIKTRVTSGYLSVTIGHPKPRFHHVHRLVGTHFLPVPDPDLMVVHKNGDKFDNRAENLEWRSLSEVSKMNSEKRKTKPVKIAKVQQKRCEIENMGGIMIELDWLPNYIILSDGGIYNEKTGRYLSGSLNDNGYMRVTLHVDGKKINRYVHRLIAEAYLPNPLPGQTEVNHKNLDRTDNRAENLEWNSPSENRQHSLRENPTQYNHLKKRVEQIDISTDKVIAVHNGIKEASKLLNINSGTIVKVCKGHRKTAGGYKWKYADE